VTRALEAGARAYLLKNLLHKELLDTIRAVYAGRKTMSPALAADLAERFGEDGLTAKEIDVLRLIAEGHANKEIAARLGITEETVKSRVKNILSKLDANDRTHAAIIGVKDTPVRRVVDRAARLIPVERRCLAFVVSPRAEIHGMFYGTPESAWSNAADLSARVHITRAARPFQQVLSCAPPMYDEIWVGGKCMYKLEPVVADGGELIIYAPHLNAVSITHGHLIEEVGYHCRDYFTKQWERFRHIPRGVLAHSTHVRGQGTFENGVEDCRISVTLASRLSKEQCERLNLGYRDPESIDVEAFAERENEGVLLVRKAGELPYRLAGA